jgi:3-hydroxyisobutyrate dehydrogenase
LIDCSTIDVKTTKEVCKTLHKKDIFMLDAPVSGGVQGAKSGNLTFMVGGNNEVFEKFKYLFEYMGNRAVYCGKTGSGQAAKICNNMILGATMIATCESFALADKLGLDRKAMFEVVSTSSGYSWSMNAYCPAPGIGPKAPSDNDYIPGFSSDLMLKDLILSQNAAFETKAITPMGNLAMKLYKDFVETKKGSGLDFSAILKTFET